MAGLVNLVLKPDADQGYAFTQGALDELAIAISVPSGEKATPFPFPVGRVPGSENIVPKPDADHGYATR